MGTLAATPARIQGLDDYHGDGPVNWKLVKFAGFDFAIHKARQGLGFDDPYFAYNWEASKAAGLITGAYLFFDPVANPILQAVRFTNAVHYGPGDLRLTLDVETAGAGLEGRVITAIDQIKEITGLYPFLYASLSFLQTNLRNIYSCPLWLAEYGVSKPRMNCDIWQHTEKGVVPGLSHLFDLDTYFGSREDMILKHTFK